MPRILIPPFALASDGTVLVNVREFFPIPMPPLRRVWPLINEPVFVGVAVTEREAQRALRSLASGHREAAGFLVGRRRKPFLSDR